MTTLQTPKQPPDQTPGGPVTSTLGAWLSAQQLVQPTQADPYDLQLAACQVLGISRAQLFAHPEHELHIEVSSELDAFAVRLHAGEPLAYLLGSQEFWSLELKVSREVLIPRPETELLVELALAKALTLLETGIEAPLLHNPTPIFVELGTGSGAVSIALASELQDHPQVQFTKPTAIATIIATDYSNTALAIAQENAQRHSVDVLLVQADWLEALSAGIDLLVSNPPYIAANDSHLPALRFEPNSALVSGTQGLDDLRSISAQAATHLNPGGWVLLEHGFDQGPAVQQMLHKHGFQAVTTEADLAGLDRVTLGQQPPTNQR